MSWTVEKRNGIYLPQIDWRLDARKPAKNVFISHAHFDHIGDHPSPLCSEGTAHLIRARLPGKREWQTHPFQKPFEIAPNTEATLYPAGHIPGSAMLHLQRNDSSLLYTGDFKLSPNATAEKCVVPKADTLIIETTYGIPKYTFPPVEEVARDIVDFCQDTLENGQTPILFGYSLGKAQELLKTLEGHSFRILLHPQVLKMTHACEEIGFTFPPYSEFRFDQFKGSVVIAPPQRADSEWLSKIPNRRTAQISGWALDESFRQRSQYDRSFPLSDHADFLDLIEFVTLVDPRIVYTTHGFAKEFAETLKERGINALELGSPDQMGLSIATPAASPKPAPQPTPSTESQTNPSPNSIAAFTETWQRLEKIDGHRRAVETASQYFDTLDPIDVPIAALFLTARAFPRASDQPLRIDPALNRQAILFGAGASDADYKRARKTQANAQLAQLSLLPKPERATRTLSDFRALFDSLRSAPNPVFQHSLLADEYRKLSPQEARALARIATGDFKSGIDEAILEGAIARRFDAPEGSVKRAHLRCSDLEQVCNAAMDRLLDYVPLKLFFPLPLETYTERALDLESLSELPLPLWIEDRYDGLRCQIHKVDDRVELFDRTGTRITRKFPEIAENAILIPQDYVADGTLVAWSKENPLPFAALKQRLTRPAQDLFIGEDTEVLLWLHDLFWFNGDSLLDRPLSYRKRELDTFSVNPRLRISPVTRSKSTDPLPSMLRDAQSRGHQGLIIKNATRPYDPLSTESAWITLK